MAGPRAALGVGDRRPLAEASPVRREGVGAAVVDEAGDLGLVELDDEVTGAAVAAGEEVAVEAQARKPIIVERVTPAWSSSGPASSQNRSSPGVA